MQSFYFYLLQDRCGNTHLDVWCVRVCKCESVGAQDVCFHGPNEPSQLVHSYSHSHTLRSSEMSTLCAQCSSHFIHSVHKVHACLHSVHEHFTGAIQFGKCKIQRSSNIEMFATARHTTLEKNNKTDSSKRFRPDPIFFLSRNSFVFLLLLLLFFFFFFYFHVCGENSI